MRLPELQAEFAALLRGEEAPALAALVAADGIDPAARLNIHRNHVRLSIASALAAGFPTVEALVGEAFFRQAAQHYSDATPPRTPCLEEHGAGFSEFLAAFEPAAALAYLPDVARLDWQRQSVLRAPDETRLDAPALAALAEPVRAAWRPQLAAACAVIESDWPIDAIWRFVHEQNGEGTLDLDQGGQTVLLHAEKDHVRQQVLTTGESLFFTQVETGAELDIALAAALDAEPTLDLGAFLANHLQQGTFVLPQA